MVKVTTGGQTYYLNDRLKKCLDNLKDKTLFKGWDTVILIDGVEGCGKSVFAGQIAKYLDPTFDLDGYCIRPADFQNGLVNGKKGKALIFDEAKRGFGSKKSMGTLNIMLANMLAESRQKNMFVIIVLPSFFDLQRDIGLWRTRCLLHVYTKHGGRRGYFRYYNFRLKKKLHLLGKKMYDYSKPRAFLNGQFVKHCVVDLKAYEKKKRDALRDYDSTVNKITQRLKSREEIQRDAISKTVTNLRKIKGMTIPRISEIVGVSKATISRYFPRKVKHLQNDDLLSNAKEPPSRYEKKDGLV